MSDEREQFTSEDLLKQRDIAIDMLVDQIDKEARSVVMKKLDIVGETNPNAVVVIELLVERLLAKGAGANSLMPETTDFDWIAERIARAIPSIVTRELVQHDIAEQLRQVWNARGAADGQALTAELQRALNAAVIQARVEINLEPLLKALDR